MSAGKASGAVRLAIVAVVIIAGAYWAGGRWGQRQPRKVEALPLETVAGTPERGSAGHASFCAGCGADRR